MHISNERGDAAGWVAIIIAVVALILSWIAYNRTGEDLENQIQREVDNAVMQVDDAAQETGQEVQEGADAVEEGVDTGPDGVDDGSQ